MDEREMIMQCYHNLYQGMIQKDIELLDEVLAESFVLVHMTGMRQTKKQYMDCIANGTLNYYSEKTESMEITFYNDVAHLIGQSRVNAAVFGGGKSLWQLQLTMKVVRANGKWQIADALAATY